MGGARAVQPPAVLVGKGGATRMARAPQSSSRPQIKAAAGAASAAAATHVVIVMCVVFRRDRREERGRERSDPKKSPLPSSIYKRKRERAWSGFFPFSDDPRRDGRASRHACAWATEKATRDAAAAAAADQETKKKKSSLPKGATTISVPFISFPVRFPSPFTTPRAAPNPLCRDRRRTPARHRHHQR